MKKIKLAVAALIIAAGTIGAFAFTNVKEETKEEATATANLHWYVVSYSTNQNGVIMNAAAHYGEGPKEAIVSPCDDGTVKDCLRGFVNPLTSFPNQSAGDDTIKRPE